MTLEKEIKKLDIDQLESARGVLEYTAITGYAPNIVRCEADEILKLLNIIKKHVSQ